jgi:oligopeptide transport system substrate-binding protein
LLAPYKDFRRSTYGALTYYAFNTSREPFDDVRVREALALAVDRERISRDELGGATEPAAKFLPDAMSGEKPVVEKADLLTHDVKQARALLAEAGYPDGEGFPVIRLLVNRNEQQRLVAQSVAAMWRWALNIETEIVLRSWDEYQAAIKAGDYDIVRRGMVMQTTSEMLNITNLFEGDSQRITDTLPAPETNPRASLPETAIETEAQALKDLKAMPIYFASSFSLVKPYVSGFDANVLDVACLKRTRLDTNWKQP